MKNKLETKTLKYITPSLDEKYRDALRKIGFEYKVDEKDDSSEDVIDVIEVDGKLLKVRYKRPNLTSQYLNNLNEKSLVDIIIGRPEPAQKPYSKRNLKGGNE